MREVLTTTCGLTMRNIKESRVDSCLIQAGNKRAEDVLEKVRSTTREPIEWCVLKKDMCQAKTVDTERQSMEQSEGRGNEVQQGSSTRASECNQRIC